MISVIIPTWRRTERLLETLDILRTHGDAIGEILIHVDAGDTETVPAVAARYPQANVLQASTSQGPGGARNRLLRESRGALVVSLDDDSYPIDGDFFAEVQACFARHPKAAVLAMSIIHDNEDIIPRSETDREVADFVGCGCAYRREAFLQTDGYVPLHPAYGMEEADVALQLLDRGWQILQCGRLRVRHATDRGHQTSISVVSAHVRNTALLAFLRYPSQLALLGVAQVANRMKYSLGRGHVLGALLGALQIPGVLWTHRARRRAVARDTVTRIRALRAI